MPDTPSAPAEANASVRCVNVPLGERSYDVLIGPGLIAEAGRLIVARLGRGRCGVVTDENVARHHLAALEAELPAWAHRRLRQCCRPASRPRASASLRRCASACSSWASNAAISSSRWAVASSAIWPDLPRHPAARRALRANPDLAAGAGRQLRRRQDRHRHAARQEPHRRVSSTGARARRHRHAAHAAGARAARRLRRGGQVRPARRCGILRLAGEKP